METSGSGQFDCSVNGYNTIFSGFSTIAVFIESKPALIFSQSPIAYVKMDAIDRLGMSSGQIILPCSQRDMTANQPNSPEIKLSGLVE